MFKKLFGSGGKDTAKAKKEAPIDTQAAMEKIDNQIENIQKRQKVLENKVNTLKQEALAKKRAKDTRGIFNSLSN
jgi:uncharacterized protein YlxW (UPF0749 family)